MVCLLLGTYHHQNAGGCSIGHYGGCDGVYGGQAASPHATRWPGRPLTSTRAAAIAGPVRWRKALCKEWRVKQHARQHQQAHTPERGAHPRRTNRATGATSKTREKWSQYAAWQGVSPIEFRRNFKLNYGRARALQKKTEARPAAQQKTA